MRSDKTNENVDMSRSTSVEAMAVRKETPQKTTVQGKELRGTCDGMAMGEGSDGGGKSRIGD